eukprot:Pgem_evm1s15257
MLTETLVRSSAALVLSFTVFSFHCLNEKIQQQQELTNLSANQNMFCSITSKYYFFMPFMLCYKNDLENMLDVQLTSTTVYMKNNKTRNGIEVNVDSEQLESSERQNTDLNSKSSIY